MHNIHSGEITKQEKAIRDLKPLADFRSDRSYEEVVHIPLHRSRRKLTDVTFLILLGLCLLTLFCLMIYTSLNADFKKITHKYDKCGNVCGKNNKKIDNIPCSGEDMTYKPYYENGQCVSQCSDLSSKSYICSKDESVEIGLLSHRSFLSIGVCALGIVFSILILFFIKYFTSIFVYSMLIGGFLLLVAATIAFGVLSTKDDQFIGPTIVFAIITLIVFILYFVIKKRIDLLIKLLKEVTKIVFKMPQIFFVPILTFSGILIATFMVIYTVLMTITSGEIVVDDNDAYIETNPIMTFVICFSIFLWIWMIQYLIACQVFVVAGSVSQTYFETYNSRSPVWDNFYNLARFHMGSTAFGSLAVTILTIIVMILNTLSRRFRILNCCCTNLKETLQYVTTMGYIEVAMHGESLCKSGRRAVNLIVANALSAFAINSVGDFVFFMGKVLVVAITVFCGYLILGDSPAGITLTIIVGVVTFFIIHSIFSVLSVALDTVFLCYCEDKALNNGTQFNPYAATIGFENYIKQAQLFEKNK